MTASGTLSRKVLQFDGGFLLLAGGAAMIIETVGHFLGVGPFAQSRGSPYTIGGFEAHGLAIIFAVLLIRAPAYRSGLCGIGLALSFTCCSDAPIYSFGHRFFS
jgi:hypothetical protein